MSSSVNSAVVPIHFAQPFSAQQGERCSKHLSNTSQLFSILQSLRAEVDRLAAAGKYPAPLNRRGLHTEVLGRNEGAPRGGFRGRGATVEENQVVKAPEGMSEFERRVRSLEGTAVDLSKICFWRGAIIVPTEQQPEMGYRSLSHVTIDYFGMKRDGAGISQEDGEALSKHLSDYAQFLVNDTTTSQNVSSSVVESATKPQ